MEVLELTFAKLYGEIDNFKYDCDKILNRLHENGLINDKRYRDIGIEHESEKNRFMVIALVKGVHNAYQFRTLLDIFYSDNNFYDLAENMMAVYRILTNTETIIRTINFEDLFTCLKQRRFFTRNEETALSEKGKKVSNIVEILKGKELDYFKAFLLSLIELNQEDVVTLDESFPNYCLYKFQCYLQKQYANFSFIETSDINFNLPISDDINIALIEISEEDHKKESTFFDYYSLLLKNKVAYTRQVLNSYSDIVVENCRVVLIQGYPGSGKTFLAKRMCTKWAKGELLQTFACVIFLQLRDEEVANAVTLNELIELQIGPLTRGTVDISKKNGKGILIILEGWDELPEKRQRSSLFTRLISGALLSEAKIVITSRPSAVRSLQLKHIQRRIEILGFTDQQVTQNITHYFLNCSNGSELMEQFDSELKRLPLLKSFVFVPINLSISLYIFYTNGYKLPETFTGMYKNLVLIQLRRYQTRTSYGSASISDLDSLPPEIDDMLLRLSKMAYDHLHNDITLIFSEAKIKEYCFDSTDKNLDNFDGMGLLQITNHRHFESINKTYEFIHRTLQELLAAWYLSRQDAPIQKKQLQSIFNKKELEMVWIFYAGLTRFHSVSFKECLPESYSLRIKISSYRAFSWMQNTFARNAFIRFPDVSKLADDFQFGKQYSYNLSRCISREFQTTLIAAVMEAQNPQLCKDVCNSYLFYGETCWFFVPESAVTPHILSALSYCIAHSGKRWIVQCNTFDKYGAECLLKYLSMTCSNSEFKKYEKHSCSTNSSISIFDIRCSQYQISGITELVHTLKHLQFLMLSYSNRVNDKILAEIAEALKDNTCLIIFNLHGCNVTSNGIESIADMLKKNKTLQWIGLKDNMATLKEEDIVLLLQKICDHNDTVLLIHLDNIFHSSDKVQDHLRVINVQRQKRGKEKLNLSLLSCFKHYEICQQFISRIPFIKEDESPSSVITTNKQTSEKMVFTFGEYPLKIECPECHEKMQTKTAAKIGPFTWIMVLLLFFAFPWLTPLFCPCLWPLLMPFCKDVSHYCSKCNAHLGVYRRM
ncbi:protein NLRC3-like [Dysidea avara]|uniref:protein NLRC3-like n=1 Tax=Dysidea avara TaxID=196820 RepID=UPI00332020A3